MTALLEVSLAWLFKNAKGHDARSFYARPAFAGAAPSAVVAVTSPDCGPSGTPLGPQHTHDGGGRFPALAWSAPPELAARVRQWLLVSEDPDALLPTPICHGIYHSIPASKTSVTSADFAVADARAGLTAGGFRFGACRRPGTVYIPPRPLLNHGPHRYFYIVVALGEELALEGCAVDAVTRDRVAEAIRGKVLGWGLWVGVAERKWEWWNGVRGG
ncbi:PEBP-like protein [Biscogniauxia sp. FL1348]|nr:PEBP-like protein [Biscogniauxia sp. FL1348]